MLESVTDCVEEAVEEAVPDWVLEALMALHNLYESYGQLSLAKHPTTGASTGVGRAPV